MARLTHADRACAVASAGAHDLNDELTIILSAVSRCLVTVGTGHPGHALLLDAQSAAQRCASKASGLLHYAARRGLRPVNGPMERLILESGEPAKR